MASTGTKPGRKKGSKATAKQAAAGKENIKKAHAARKKRKQDREATGVLEKPRWKQLEDGDISLKDLSLKELVRGECANNDGSWEGRRHRFSPKMQQKMYTEFKRQFRRDFDNLAPLAIDAIEDILQDTDNPAQRWAAAKTMVEYQMGKVPDVVHVGQETEFERLSQTGFVILRGRENVEPDVPAALEGGDTIPGEAEWSD